MSITRTGLLLTVALLAAVNLYAQGGGCGKCIGPKADAAAAADAANPATAPQALSEAEKASLLFMYEEEKLARDVYLKLGETWSLRPFQNISQAEQRHMDMVAGRLTAQGIELPVKGDDHGTFTQPELTKLYAALTTEGLISAEAALGVGARVEEIDIRDLTKALGETENPELKQLYENLKAASHNHLRAFAGNLKRRTGEYKAQVMAQTDVDSILAQSQGGGFGRGRHGRAWTQ